MDLGRAAVCFRRGDGYVGYDMSEVYVSGAEFIVLSFRTSKHMCPGLDGWQTRGVWIVVKCSKRTLRQTFFCDCDRTTRNTDSAGATVPCRDHAIDDDDEKRICNMRKRKNGRKG